MRIAIVGSGISGLGSAWLLANQGHAVTVFERESRLGGHSHTVDVTLEGRTAPVDTGFLVYNERTYPRLIALFDALGVASTTSTMSFSLRNDRAGVEWSGTSLRSLFAQPANALRPAFWRMLLDIARFNRNATSMHLEDRAYSISLGEYLEAEAFSPAFRDWYLLPMAAAIWSSPQRDILDFPLPSFIRFCHNHGLLQVVDRPRWRTVVGGARSYVERIAQSLPDVRAGTPVLAVRRHAHGVEIDSPARSGERFDEVVLACHSDQAAWLLADATAGERELLAGVRYQPNRVVLHTDARLMPRRRRAWSAWNYLAGDDASGAQPAAVTYWINALQPLPFRTPVLVTLNPPFEPARETLLGEFEYAHPLLDAAAIAAQRRLASLQGRRHTWFAGAWLGYGFHEDGLASAHAVADGISARARIARPRPDLAVCAA